MHSPTKQSKHKCASLSGLFEGLEIEATSDSTKIPSTRLNIAKLLRQHIQSTFRLGTTSLRRQGGVPAHFTFVMDEAYAYNIGVNEFEPDEIFPEIITLGNQLSAVLQHQLTPEQETAFEDTILDCLVGMVYGSNMIERAGGDLDITLKLCMAIFRGEEVPEDIGESDGEFLELKRKLIRDNLPADTCAVLRSRREIIQHAEAAFFMISQLCIQDKDLSEEILLQAHGILTYKVDAVDTPWEEYSGVYRKHDVSAGFHTFPHHTHVSYKMKAMIRELERDLQKAVNKGTIDPIAIASKYTHIFVNIHPFADGNGRMCRLVLNSILLKLGSFLVRIGEKEEDRHLYLEVACKSSALEDLYEELDEEERPAMHKELGSFVMLHVKKSMHRLVAAVLL